MTTQDAKSTLQSLITRGLGGRTPVAMEARRAADAARDNRQWAVAAAQYSRYLETAPNDAAIWVQCGHARKESGDLAGAVDAYQRAEVLTPNDADLLLHHGALLARLKRSEEAAVRFAASLKLAPSQAAQEGLASMGEHGRRVAQRAVVPVGGQTQPGCIYMQVNDLFVYLQHHRTVSGIQRVQLGVIEYALACEGLADTAPTAFVFSHLRGTQLWLVSSAKVRAVASYVSGRSVDHAELRRLVKDATDNAVPVTPGRGDVFLLLGAFWGQGASPDLIRRMKANGVRTGIFFYDLIPITHPEFCDKHLIFDFTNALLEALSFIDFGTAISEYTAGEVRRFIAEAGLAPVPIEAVPLAHHIRHPEKAVTDGEEWPVAIAALQGRRFVLCVGTIEIRKNHRYLFDAWKAMQGEKIDVPDLVFVGRQGWRVDDFMAQLDATQNLNGQIRILYDLSDTELATLYTNCYFTVFPSVVEGWGLPIGESLAYGKLCVASNTTSMPEVGGDLVEYIDPWNLRQGLDVFRALIQRPERVVEHERAIRSRFKPRDWMQVSRNLIETVRRLGDPATNEPTPAYIPKMEPGIPFRPVALRKISATTEAVRQRLQYMMLYDRWNQPEDFGCWLEGSQGHIAFGTSVGPDRPVIVYLGMRSVGWLTDHTLTVRSELGPEIVTALGQGREFMLRLKCSTDANGQVLLRLLVSGELTTQGEDTRLLSIGLGSIAFAPADDAMSRSEALEAMQIDMQSM